MYSKQLTEDRTRTRTISIEVMETAKVNSTLIEIDKLEHNTEILVIKQQTLSDSQEPLPPPVIDYYTASNHKIESEKGKGTARLQKTVY